MRLIASTLSLALLLLATCAAALAAADQPTDPARLPPVTGLTVVPARIEASVKLDGSPFSSEISVTNRGARPARATAELTDLVITKGGAYQSVPAGETPYSISTVAHLDRDSLDLDASGQPQAVGSIRIEANTDQLQQPLYGMVAVSVEEAADSPVALGAVSVVPQVQPTVLVPIALVPLDATGAPAAAVQLDLSAMSLSVGQRGQGGLLDSILAFSIPGVADHGAIQATESVENTGNSFGRAFTKFSFSGVSPLGWVPGLGRAVGLDERPFLEAEAAPAALMPGDRGETTTSSTYSVGPDSQVDATPWFGLIRVRATTSLVLADLTSDPVVQDAYILVFPWKEALALVAAWLVLRQVRSRLPGRRRRSAARKQAAATEAVEA